MPISFFLSVTVTIIIFIMPMPPTRSDIPATAESIILISAYAAFICAIMVSGEVIHTTFSEPVSFSTSCFISVSTVATISASAAFI